MLIFLGYGCFASTCFIRSHGFLLFCGGGFFANTKIVSFSNLSFEWWTQTASSKVKNLNELERSITSFNSYVEALC